MRNLLLSVNFNIAPSRSLLDLAGTSKPVSPDLIALRTEKGVDKLLPGITGWAQVNGRDELSIPDKVALDVEYLNRQSFWLDVKILWMTFLKVMNRDGVSH